MKSSIATVAIAAWVVAGAACTALRARTNRSVWDGVYSEAQALRGTELYDKECAGCHGPNGEGGGMAPALVGSAFTAPNGRIAIVEQDYEDPIAMMWDLPEDRIRPEQVNRWMSRVGFRLEASFDIFKGANNPKGTGMPERWFVLDAREAASDR
jgi:Cytochrome c